MDVVPTQVLYNDLAACHAAARRRGPIGDESVVAIPGHLWGRFTCGSTSISFQLVTCQSHKKKLSDTDESRHSRIDRDSREANARRDV